MLLTMLSWQCRMVSVEKTAYCTLDVPLNYRTTQLPESAMPTSQCPIQSYAASRIHTFRPCMLASQEANYAHQQELDMIPLMMQNNYSPKGWLGLILGTRMW